MQPSIARDNGQLDIGLAVQRADTPLPQAATLSLHLAAHSLYIFLVPIRVGG